MKIQLVIIDEHTLGAIHPDRPQQAEILHGSILRGATSATPILTAGKKVRLASKEDFNAYRVSFEGYSKEPDIYDWDKWEQQPQP